LPESLSLLSLLPKIELPFLELLLLEIVSNSTLGLLSAASLLTAVSFMFSKVLLSSELMRLRRVSLSTSDGDLSFAMNREASSSGLMDPARELVLESLLPVGLLMP